MVGVMAELKVHPLVVSLDPCLEVQKAPRKDVLKAELKVHRLVVKLDLCWEVQKAPPKEFTVG